jgi:hypothetical protein
MNTIEVKSKWWSDKYNIGITENKNVYRINSDNSISELNREYSCNRLVWRVKGENNRIGEKSLMKSLILKEKIIQQYLPF